MARNRRPRIYDQDHEAREGEPLAVQVIATDRNPGDTLTYSIVRGNGQGLFQIDPLTGIISRADGGAFDYETDAHRYDLRVRVTDDGNPPKSRTGDVTIRITDVNDAPNEIALSNQSLVENAAGATVGIVTVADQDDDIHGLSVDDARFEFVGDTLKLKDGISLDHEAGDTVTVTITATDDEGGSLSQEFAVAVTDVNEAPTVIALSNASVNENAAGAVIGTLTVADPDDPAGPFGGHTFTVDDARFEIAGGVLKLVDGVALDHEAVDSVTVTVSATDGGGLVTTETFTISVDDVNEAPTAIALSDVSVDENAVGAIVGSIAVTDPDDPARPFGSHTITVDDARFEIVGDTLKLRDDVTLDHEAGDRVAVTVTATDGGGATISQTFDIAVNDVNESPTTITLSNAVVVENAAGATIGAVAVADPDDPLSPFGTHAITVDDARFEVVGGVLKLKNGISLDHEADASIPVIVTATDGGGASVSQIFDIGVTDANDAPTSIAVVTQGVDEATPGAIVGAVMVADQDDPTGLFGMHDVTVSDVRFEVVDGILKLKDGVTLDYAGGSWFSVLLTATDGGGLSVSQYRTITVNEIDETPVVEIDAVETIAEEETGVVIGQVIAFDPDVFDGSSGWPTVSVDDPRFEVVTGQLKLKDGASVDFETEPTVTVTVTATDATGLSASQSVTLTVRDVVDGRTFISLGSLDGINGSRLFSSDPADGVLGFSISGAGDVNGDGYADMIVGVPLATAGPEAVDEGASYVVFGTEAGYPADFDLALLDGTNGFRIDGTDTDYGGLGGAVSGAGDVNGDGFADILVGATPVAAAAGSGWPLEPPPPTNESFVIFGKADGWMPTVDLETIGQADGIHLVSSIASNAFAYLVSDLGDFNGDGFADIVVGDPGAAISGEYSAEGVSYVVFGSGTGLPAELDLANLDGANGFRIDGAQPGDAAGYVRGVGDLNGDGYDDLAIGAQGGYDPGGEPTGMVHVIFGDSGNSPPTLDLGLLEPGDGFTITGLQIGGELFAVDSAGDVNGDGHDDLIVGTTGAYGGFGEAYVVYGSDAGFPVTVDVLALDGSNGFRIDGPGDGYFAWNVAGAGDVNADGVDDLMIAGGGTRQAGAVYVMYGQVGGFADGLDVSQIDGTDGFRLDGVTPYAALGFSMDSPGDVNGDGFADLLISAPFGGSINNSTFGEAHLFYGGDFTDSVGGLGTAGADMLAGTAAADSLVGAQGDDVLTGAGGADVLYGGAGDDVMAVGDTGFARIDGGSGTDTLRLDGAGQSLDLTAIGNAVIEGVEKVDLTGTGDNTMTLAINDLLNLSDESNDLFVSGDAGDQVTLAGDWRFDGAATMDGVTYNSFGVDGVQAALYVEDDVVVPGPGSVSVALSNLSVDENADGAAIGALSVTDAGNPVTGHGFTVDDARFEVVGGVLKLKAGQTLDHEAQGEVTVTVAATNGFTVSQAFDVSVNNLNDAPTSIELSGVSVNELAAGAIVGAVTVVDQDDPAQPFGMHGITVDDARFEVVDGLLKLQDGVSLDRADGASIDLVLTATDGGGLSVGQQIAIAVENVNEAPILTVTTIGPVAEEDTNLFIGQATTVDPDRADGTFEPISYSVDDPRFFIFSGGNIYLRADATLDFETEPTVTFTVTATDSAGLSASQAVTVDVLDIVEGKTFFSLIFEDDSFTPLVDFSGAEGAAGFSVSGAGDVNGDGYADMIVGAPLATAGPEAFSEGASYVIFGSGTGLPGIVDIAGLDGTNGFRINGTDTDLGGLGIAVSGAGDLNGDGYADLLVSAAPLFGIGPGSPPQPFPPSNESFVIFGKADGWTPTVELDSLGASDGFRMFDPFGTDEFGFTVDDIGDFNGDGFADIAIGDPRGFTGIGTDGVSYVLFGGDMGWPTDLDLRTLDGNDGFRILSGSGGEAAGNVQSAGDLNSDGYDDIVVGKPGSAYVVFGGAGSQSATLDLGQLGSADGFQITGLDDFVQNFPIASAGDVNGDGHEDLIIGSSGRSFGAAAAFVVYGDADGPSGTIDVSALDGTNGFRIDGPPQSFGPTSASSFGFSVSGAGDVNGDGIDDLMVARDSNIYLLYGREGGWPDGFDAGLIDGTNGFRMDTSFGDGFLGYSISAAGDVDGDGFSDMLIGDLGSGPVAGYIFYGDNFDDAVTGLGTTGADTLTGTVGADSLVGAQGDDLLVGGGGADVLYGGSGDDILAVGDIGFARIDGGSGTDTLRLDGAGEVLDLTGTGDTVIDGIERIDLTGSGDNSATLAITDLLQISDESNDLFVAGDTGDQVTVLGDWQNAGPATVDGVTYDVFSVAGVEASLYVEDDVTVTVAGVTGV